MPSSASSSSSSSSAFASSSYASGGSSSSSSSSYSSTVAAAAKAAVAVATATKGAPIVSAMASGLQGLGLSATAVAGDAVACLCRKPPPQLDCSPTTVSNGDRLPQPLEVAIAMKLHKQGFTGTPWFRSRAQAYAYAAGTAEGVGVWRGMGQSPAEAQWINLDPNRTIVLGEAPHDPDRVLQFCAQLNIRRCLFERYSERSFYRGAAALAGPAAPESDDPHDRPYTGDERHQALENYWLRIGGVMGVDADAFIADLDNLVKDRDVIEMGLEQGVRPLQELGKPLMILGAIQSLIYFGPEDVPGDSDLDNALNGAIVAAKNFRRSLPILKKLQAACEPPASRSAAASASSTPAAQPGAEQRKKALLEMEMADLRQLLGDLRAVSSTVQALARIQYHNSGASLAEKAADLDRELRGERGHALWSPRRDAGIAANLRAAMGVEPRPMLVTMGARHADRLQQSGLFQQPGMDVAGGHDIAAVAAFGSVPPRA